MHTHAHTHTHTHTYTHTAHRLARADVVITTYNIISKDVCISKEMKSDKIYDKPLSEVVSHVTPVSRDRMIACAIAIP